MLGKPRTMKLTGLSVLMILTVCGAARAGDDPFWDEWARYFQRTDPISVTSGDAKNVNAVTHIIDPWPPYARDRRIPANGQRMVGAINRYQNPKLLGAKAPTLAPIITQNLQGGAAEDTTGTPLGGYGGQ
jgi:hypothetical protein